MSSTCSAGSLAAREPLGGTGIEASRWLCVESRVAWGRDVIDDEAFPEEVAAWLGSRSEKVLAIRRPGRRGRPYRVFAAETTETGGRLLGVDLDRIDDLPSCDAWAGEPIDGTLLLVCAHGRRDACCSRLGLPVYRALDGAHAVGLVWQCSHTGGHRFAANVVALPWGVTLGRVAREEAPEVAALLAAGRIPLDRYRGRSLYPPAVQAAEVAVRRSFALDRLADVLLIGRDGDVVRFDAGGLTVEATVTERSMQIAKSCGADAELVTYYDAHVRPAGKPL